MNTTFNTLLKPNTTLNQPALQPMNQTPNNISVNSKPRPDRLQKLINDWNSVKFKPNNFLDKLFQSEEFGGLLSQSMNTMFPLRSTSKSQEILKNKKVVPELSSRHFGELFNTISLSLNICIGTVYEILESKLLILAKKQTINWVFNPSSQVVLEKIVSQQWHEDRLKFLKLRNEIIEYLDNPTNPKTPLIRNWINKSCKEKSFLKGLINDLETLINIKAANFSETNQFIRNLAKIKEQNFLIVSIFQLVKRGFRDEKAEDQLIKVILETKFLGIFSEKLTEGYGQIVSNHSEKTQDNFKIMFESLLLELLFQQLKLEKFSEKELESLTKRAINFDKVLMNIEKENCKVEMMGDEGLRKDANTKLNENTYLLSNAYIALVNLCRIEYTKRGIKSEKLNDLDSILKSSDESDDSDDSLSEVISTFLNLLDDSPSNNKKFIRGTLLKFLKVLLYMSENTQYIGVDDQEIQLMIFGEIMKDKDIFIQFWNNYSKETNYFSKFVKSNLGKFPYNTSRFLDMVIHLSGSSDISFHQELVDMLAHLEIISSEVKTFEFKSTETNDKEGNLLYILKEDIEIQAGFHVNEGTLFYYQDNGNQVCFIGDWNFWEIMWMQLTSMVNGVREEYSFTDDQRKMIYCFCQIIRECPNLLVRIENYMIGSIEDYDNESSDNETGEVSLEEAQDQMMEVLAFGNENYQNSGGIISILLLMELLKLSLESENSMELVKGLLSSLLSLLQSSLNFQTQIIFHFYSLVCSSKLNVMHPLLNIQMIFDQESKELEAWTESETTRLEIQCLIIEISIKLIENNDVLIAEMRERENLKNLNSQLGNPNIEQMFNLLDNQEFEPLLQNLMGRIFYAYEELISEDFWSIKSLKFASLLQKYNIKDFNYGKGLLENLLNDILVNGCRKILNHDIEVNEQNQYLKYKVMSSLMRFTETFVDKFRLISGSSELHLKKTEDKSVSIKNAQTKNSFFEKLKMILNKIPLAELILECLECRVHQDSFVQKSSPSSLESSKTIGNKHWILNVIQKKNETSRKSIREYLVSGIDLLNKCILILSSQNIHDQNFKEISDIIGQKDNIYEFSFAYQSQTKKANLLVSICSLLNFDDSKGLGPFFRANSFKKNLRIGIIKSLFDSSPSPESVLYSLNASELFNHFQGTNINLKVSLRRSKQKELLSFAHKVNNRSFAKLELVRSKLCDDDSFMKTSSLRLLSQSPSSSTTSLSSSVLQLLSNLSVFWSFNSRLTRPDLFEFLSGKYNDLPNAQSIFNNFAHSLIKNLLHNSNEIVCRTLDFLNNLCQSQKHLIHKLIFVEDNSTSVYEGLLLSYIQKLIAKLINKAAPISEFKLAELRVIRQKLCCFIYQILADETLPKKTLMHFWDTTFVQSVNIVIEDFCTESTFFLSSISDFMSEIQKKVKNDFSFKREGEPIEDENHSADEDYGDHKLEGDLDVNFSMAQFVRIINSKSSASALLYLYYSLLQTHFFALRKPRFKSLKKKVQDGIIQMFKHSLTDISEKLYSNSSVVMIKYFKYFSSEVHRILDNIPKNNKKYLQFLSKVTQSNSHLSNYFVMPLVILPNKSPLQLLNFCPSKQAFITCKELGISNLTCSTLSNAICVLNQCQRSLFWTQSLSNKFSLFFEILSANGINGRLMSNSLIPSLSPSRLSHYVFYMANLYKSSNSAKEQDYRKLLRSSNMDLFSEHISLQSESTLNMNENKYLNIFFQDNAYQELNLVKLLGEENTEKPTISSCKNMINKIVQLLKFSNEYMLLILQELDIPNLLTRIQENCISRCMQIYLFSLQPLLKSMSHILCSLLKFSSKIDNIENLRKEILSPLIPHLKEMLQIFSDLSIYSMKMSSIDFLTKLQFSICLFYFFYSLKLLQPSLSNMSPTFSLRSMLKLDQKEVKYLDMVCLYLKKQLFAKDSSNHKSILVLLFDWLSSLYPSCLDSSALSHLSLNFKYSNLSSDVYLLTAQFFYKLLIRIKRISPSNTVNSNRKIKSEIHEEPDRESNSSHNSSWQKESLRKIFLNSQFLDNLSKTMRFLEDSKFLAVNFYDDKIRNTTQAHFRLTLDLLVKFCEIIGNTNGRYNQIYLFLERHAKRIYTVLGLSQITSMNKPQSTPKKSLFADYSIFDQDQPRESSQSEPAILLPFRNLAFIEELKSTLHLLHHLSKDSKFWKLRNKSQFDHFNSLIRLKTMLFFLSDSSTLGRSESMIDQIRPISSYEEFLHDSKLKEGSVQPMFLPGIRSISKLTVSGRKSSMRNDILQFSNMKNNYVTSSTSSGNLFRFQLQQLSYSIAFHLLGFLSFTSDEFSVIRKIDSHSNKLHGDLYSVPLSQNLRQIPKLSSAFWSNFSEQILSIQLYLLSAYYKICMKQELCRDGLMRLSLIQKSLNAYTESHGLSVLSSPLSMKHLRVVIQQSFEMSLFLQNKLFMDFDNSSTQNRPPILDQLKRDKDKSKMLLDDFGRIGRGDDVHIQKGTGSVGFKSSMRKATLSMSKRGNQPLMSVKESPEFESEDKKSNHRKFLKFIHDYYVTK